MSHKVTVDFAVSPTIVIPIFGTFYDFINIVELVKSP